MSVKPIERDLKKMALGQKTIALILFYYAVILVLSSYKASQLQSGIDNPEPGQASFFCVLLSLTGSSIFYSRKLYKACIDNTYNFDNGATAQKIGTFSFFFLRPLFAAVFSWITHMIWEASIISSVSSFNSFSATHFYLSGVLGFFVGFLTGRVIGKAEAAGEKHLNGVW